MLDREAFQEIDYRRMYGTVAKWAAQVDRAERIPEYLSRAFVTAMSGRPGPVVLALPEDVLAATVDVPDLPRAFDEVFERVFSGDLSERHRSADEFRRALLSAPLTSIAVCTVVVRPPISVADSRSGR